MLSPEDQQFLLEMRDYLNSLASPATGGTIAFSTLVSDRAATDIAANADATLPGYSRLATKLRNWIWRLMWWAIAALLAVTILAAYVYWGNSVVTGAAAVNTRMDALLKDIDREEAARAAGRVTGRTTIAPPAGIILSGAGAGSDANGTNTGQPPVRSDTIGLVIFLCNDTVNTSDIRITAYHSATQESLCRNYYVLNEQLNTIREEITAWGRPLFIRGPQGLEVASYYLSTINGYFIPLLMGFLGSAAFVLRQHLRNLGERLLTTRDLQANRIRLVLGTLSGLAIGFFLSPSAASNAGQMTNSLGMGVNLTAPALAFLAGYAVDVLFRFLDTIAGQVFVTKA